MRVQFTVVITVNGDQCNAFIAVLVKTFLHAMQQLIDKVCVQRDQVIDWCVAQEVRIEILVGFLDGLLEQW